MKKLVSLLLVLAVQAFGVVPVVSRTFNDYSKQMLSKKVEIVTIAWTADASNGSVPTITIPLNGFCLKAVTVPGSTAPTALYDIALGDPASSALDALNGALKDRSATVAETVQPVLTGGTSPIFLAGNYTFTVSNNSVNSATGTVILYLVD
jgi:hypothetical protein